MSDEGIMDIEQFEPKDTLTLKLVVCGICLVVALLSFFVLGGRFSKPEAYSRTVASLDAKKETVMGLVAASTAASATVSLLPGDAGTPVAEKLIDLSADFMIVLAAIYLEKYLLTILGLAAFRLLIPLACVAIAAGFCLRNTTHMGSAFMGIGAKLVFFGLAIVMVVPASVFISSMVERTYESSVQDTIETAAQTTQTIENVAQQDTTDKEGQSILDIVGQIPNALQSLPDTVTGLTEEVQTSVNNLIEALAVMVVTSCVIPILVLLFFLWLVQVILGVKIDIPYRSLRGHKPRTRPHAG